MTDKTNHKIIEHELRTFPWDNYGLDDVDIALHDRPQDQEWVQALADNIWYELQRAERLK